MRELEYTQSRKTTATTIKSCDYYDTTLLSPQAWADAQKQWGWCNPALGDWPLTIIANGANNERFIVKEYSEGTVYTWIYTQEQREEYAHHLDQLKAYWKERRKQA